MLFDGIKLGNKCEVNCNPSSGINSVVSHVCKLSIGIFSFLTTSCNRLPSKYFKCTSKSLGKCSVPFRQKTDMRSLECLSWPFPQRMLTHCVHGHAVLQHFINVQQIYKVIAMQFLLLITV